MNFRTLWWFCICYWNLQYSWYSILLDWREISMWVVHFGYWRNASWTRLVNDVLWCNWCTTLRNFRLNEYFSKFFLVAMISLGFWKNLENHSSELKSCDILLRELGKFYNFDSLQNFPKCNRFPQKSTRMNGIFTFCTSCSFLYRYHLRKRSHLYVHSLFCRSKDAGDTVYYRFFWI